MNSIKSLVPMLSLLAAILCLAVGVAAVYAAVAFTVSGVLVLVCNPFGILDGITSTKSRGLLSVAAISVLVACIAPVRPALRFVLVALAFGFVWFSCRYNRHFLSVEQRPVKLYYGKRVERTLTAMRASEENLGWERQLWRQRGVQATQTALMMQGIAFDSASLARMETAYIVGANSVRRDAQEKSQLRRDMEYYKELSERLDESLKEALSEAQAARDNAWEANIGRSEWERKAAQQEQRALELSKQLLDGGTVTPETVRRMLSEGMSGKEVAALTGLSQATISRMRKK